MPSTTYYFLGGDASDVNSYEVFQDGTYQAAQSLPGSGDGVFAGGPTMSGGSLSVSFLGVAPGQAPSGTSSFEVAGGSIAVHTLTVGGSTLTADVPLTLTSQTSDYGEIALGAGAVLTAKKGIVWGQGNNAVLVSDPGTLLDFGTAAVTFGNPNINYAIFYDGAAVKAGAVTIGGGPGLYGTLSIRGTKMDGSAGQASQATFASLTVGGSAGKAGQSDNVSVQGGGALTVAGAMSIGTQAGSTTGNNFVQVTGAGSKLVANTLTVGGETATVDDCGNWTYTGGQGSFGVDTGGYASIGKTLTLASGDTTFLGITSGASLEIGGNSGAVADQVTIDAGGSLVGHGTVYLAPAPKTPPTMGKVVNNGTIEAKNGTLTIGGDVSGTGNAQIDDQSTLELQGAFAAGGTVTFNGGYQTTLRLDDPKGFDGTIAGLALGDTIYLPGNALQSQYFSSPSNLNLIAHTQISGSNLVITYNNGATQNYKLSGDYSGDTFSVRQMNGFDEALTLQKATPQITTKIPGEGYGNPYVDSLIQGWAKWNPSSGPITYYLGGQGDVASEVKQHGSTTFLACGQTVDPWSAQAQADVTQAFADYAAVSGLTFAPAASAASANIVLWATNPGNLGGAATERPDQVSNGHEWAIFNDQNTTIWPYLQPGGDGNTEIVHEIGHALGLAHPTDGGNEPDATIFNDAQNQAVDTVMSYNRGWSGQPPPNPTSYGGQSALGALDIAAIQAIYGPNTSYKTGDDTYQLPTLNQAGTGWSSIWDTGGTDTISNAGSSAPCTIDLRAAPLTGPNAGGYESYVHGVAGGFTIANGVAIEKAVGGGGSDTLTTGNPGDTLTGGGGDDTFSGMAADWNLDTITDLSRGDTIHILDANPAGFTYSFAPGSTSLTFASDAGAASRTILLPNAPTDAFAAVSDPQGGEDLFLVKPGSLSLSDTTGGATSVGSQAVSGFADASAAGSTVALYDNGGQVGTTTVAADGTWSASTPLVAGANSVFAVDIAAAGITAPVTYTFAANPAAPPPATSPGVAPPPAETVPPPNVTIDPGVTFAGRTAATLTGTATDSAAGGGITNVELFEGSSDLGAATLDGDGTWTFTHDFGVGAQTGITATATDAAGLSAATASPSTFDTGSHGRGIGAVQTILNPDGSVAESVYFRPNGATLYDATDAPNPDGSTSYTYSGGTFFNHRPYSSFTDTYAAGGDLITHVQDNKDGSHAIQGFADGLVLHALGNDTITGGGGRETFAFAPGFGTDTITDFQVNGLYRDTLDLTATRYKSVAQVLAHTIDTTAGATIKLNGADSIILANVTKAELAHHPHDFAFA